MLARLTNTATITIDLPSDHCTWSATTTREHGDASVRVPRTSPAFDPAYIDDIGGFLVELSYRNSGWWTGIADRPQFDPSGVTLNLLHIANWLDIRLLTRSRTFYACPAGMIAQVAVQDALVGLGVAAIVPGTFVIGAPLIPKYQFTGQSLLSCLTDLTGTSGDEWEIVDGVLNWVPSQGRYHEFHLVDDGQYIATFTDGSLQDMAAEVIEIQPDGSQLIVSADEAPAFWPRQVLSKPS